jgi:hypothetical protein
MKITELFDQPVAYKWTTQAPHDRYVAKFDIEGAEYMVSAHWFPYEDDNTGNDLDGYDFNFCRMEGKKCRSDLTNTGHEHVIFATVVAVFRDLTTKVRIDRIAFSAEEESRKRLYQHMIKRLLPTWKLSYHEGEVYYYDKPQRQV